MRIRRDLEDKIFVSDRRSEYDWNVLEVLLDLRDQNERIIALLENGKASEGRQETAEEKVSRAVHRAMIKGMKGRDENERGD